MCYLDPGQGQVFFAPISVTFSHAPELCKNRPSGIPVDCRKEAQIAYSLILGSLSRTDARHIQGKWHRFRDFQEHGCVSISHFHLMLAVGGCC